MPPRKPISPVETAGHREFNYVTPSGLTQLQAKVAELQTLLGELNALGELADKQREADLQRDLRYFNQRLQSAQVVPPPVRRRRCRSAAA